MLDGKLYLQIAGPGEELIFRIDHCHSVRVTWVTVTLDAMQCWVKGDDVRALIVELHRRGANKIRPETDELWLLINANGVHRTKRV